MSMKIDRTHRGFHCVECPLYPVDEVTSGRYTDERLLMESSAVGDYDDSLDKPGSSFLWISGMHHHLNREQVQEMIEHMQRWLRTGCLSE